MRLFVALDVGPDVRRHAAGVIDELKRRARRLAPHARVSWVTPERLHVTVRFIGEVDASIVPSILSALAPPVSVPPFDLTIATTGAFPPGRPPRVLWAGITGGVERLRAVEREIAVRLARVPLPADDQPYNPHLTLARIKHPAGLRSAALLEGLGETVFGVVRVGAVTLCESRTSPSPEYVALGRTSLAR